jgi:type IV pilus assembly protein PilM
MLNFKNRYPIGIDFADDHIYAAQFQKTRQGIAVRELFHGRLDNQSTKSDAPGENMVPVLRQIAGNRNFRGKRVSIHLPPQHVYSFPVTFETGMNETREEAIVRECRRYLSFPLEEAVIDYPSISEILPHKETSSDSKRPLESKRKYKANIIAARRDQLEQYVHLLKTAGLSVEVIDFDLSSLLRLHNYIFPINDHPVVLCDIGHHQSLMAVITKDNILAQRNVKWGLQPLLDRLETNFELAGNAQQVSGMLNKYGLYYEDHLNPSRDAPHGTKENVNEALDIYRTIFQILSPYVDGLVHELYQITGYVRSELQNVKFEEIVMYGQANAIRALDRYVEKRISISTKSVDPMLKLIRSQKGNSVGTPGANSFAKALGLAMREISWL